MLTPLPTGLEQARCLLWASAFSSIQWKSEARMRFHLKYTAPRQYGVLYVVVSSSQEDGPPSLWSMGVSYLRGWRFPGALSIAFRSRCQSLNPGVPEVDTAEEQGTERLLETGLTWTFQGQSKARLSGYWQPCIQTGADQSRDLRRVTKTPSESF